MTNYPLFSRTGAIILFLGLLFSPSVKAQEPQDHVHGNLGTRYWEQGKLDLAEKETRKAIDLNSNSSLWYQNLGVILKSAGRHEESALAFIKALNINNDWGSSYKTGALMEAGYYYYSKRDYKRSISTLEKAIATAVKEDVPSDTLKELYLYLSYNYTDATLEVNPFYDLEKAQALKTKAYELAPEDLFVKASITKLYILQKKLDLARKTITEIETKLEGGKILNSSSVYAYLGHIYSLLDDSSSCAAAMMKSIELNPEYASNYLITELDNDFSNVAKSEDMKQVIERARQVLLQ
jgi:tetratricopeptide (TPR) repeat protein